MNKEGCTQMMNVRERERETETKTFDGEKNKSR